MAHNTDGKQVEEVSGFGYSRFLHYFIPIPQKSLAKLAEELTEAVSSCVRAGAFVDSPSDTGIRDLFRLCQEIKQKLRTPPPARVEVRRPKYHLIPMSVAEIAQHFDVPECVVTQQIIGSNVLGYAALMLVPDGEWGCWESAVIVSDEDITTLHLRDSGAGG